MLGIDYRYHGHDLYRQLAAPALIRLSVMKADGSGGT